MIVNILGDKKGVFSHFTRYGSKLGSFGSFFGSFCSIKPSRAQLIIPESLNNILKWFTSGCPHKRWLRFKKWRYKCLYWLWLRKMLFLALFGSIWLMYTNIWLLCTLVSLLSSQKKHFDMIKVSRCDSFKENDEICDIFNIFRVQIGKICPTLRPQNF